MKCHYLSTKTTQSYSNNKDITNEAIESVEGTFTARWKLPNDYNDFMNEVIGKAFAEKVPDAELHATKAYYIPHYGVYNLNKPQKKIHVVCDCSPKFASSSLNDNLLQGPGTWRTRLSVFCADSVLRLMHSCVTLRKCFTCSKSKNKEHRDYLRFLCWKDGNTYSEVKEFRMTVHLFGVNYFPVMCQIWNKTNCLWCGKKSSAKQQSLFICEWLLRRRRPRDNEDRTRSYRAYRK